MLVVFVDQPHCLDHAHHKWESGNRLLMKSCLTLNPKLNGTSNERTDMMYTTQMSEQLIPIFVDRDVRSLYAASPNFHRNLELGAQVLCIPYFNLSICSGLGTGPAFCYSFTQG